VPPGPAAFRERGRALPEEAHTPEESVNFAQVLKAAEIYLNFALIL
jgi:acetylornithine deacetylase/succinyl-diaminopimelate desuccinylase-like protein